MGGGANKSFSPSEEVSVFIGSNSITSGSVRCDNNITSPDAAIRSDRADGAKNHREQRGGALAGAREEPAGLTG